MTNSGVFHTMQLLGAIALLLGTAGGFELKVGESCEHITRSGEVCTRYPNCPNRLRMLTDLRKVDEAKFLKSFQETWCGKDGDQDLVCCDSPVETLITEDVSQHPNLHLLRQDICGPISQDRIVNGNKVKLFELPWMAINTRKTWNSDYLHCGATLISDRYVLTAAHCIELLVPNYIRLGEHNKLTEIDCEENFDGEKRTKICAPKPQDIPIEDIIVHPNYIGYPYVHYYDVALVRLSHLPDFSTDAVRPICLPIGLSQQTLNLTGKMVDVAGWGRTEEGIDSNELLKGTIPVDKYKCRGWPPTSTVSHICAGGGIGEIDSCRGDSGGPLTYIGEVNGSIRTIQYGIVSAGPEKCGYVDIGGIYTNVGHYMKWILDNMKP